MPNLNTGLKKPFAFQAVVERGGSLSTTGCRSRALRNGGLRGGRRAANGEFLTVRNHQDTDFLVQFADGTLGGDTQRDKIAARADHSLAAKMGDDRLLVTLVRFAHALVLEELGVRADALLAGEHAHSIGQSHSMSMN